MRETYPTEDITTRATTPMTRNLKKRLNLSTTRVSKMPTIRASGSPLRADHRDTLKASGTARPRTETTASAPLRPQHHVQDDHHDPKSGQRQLRGKQVYVMKCHIVIATNALPPAVGTGLWVPGRP